jgi:hypothetical protein
MRFKIHHSFALLIYVLPAVLLPVSCQTTGSSSAPLALEAEFPPEEEDMLESDDFAGFTSFSDDLVRLPESEFGEVWAYVIARSEKYLKTGQPITDVVYFGATVDRYGTIVDIPSRRNLPRFNGRVHVSITCEGWGLTHFLLDPESKARSVFFNALVEMARDYDGLNIDLENVPVRDAAHFLSLLGELKAALGGKILSVCVPARDSENTTYNYTNIAGVADKVFVMAYDEHWAGSKPGPVASMNWCKRVASYALRTIGARKLVMGLPLYGRAWANKTTARALIASTTDSIIKTQDITTVRRENGIPTFTYDVNVTVTVYFEDAYSLALRMEMYQNMGIDKIGFWRMGYEDAAVWNYLKIRKPGQP